MWSRSLPYTKSARNQGKKIKWVQINNKQNAILPKYKTVSLKFSPIYHKSPFHLEQPFENERPHLSKHMEMGFISEENCQIIKILLCETEESRMWPGCLWICKWCWAGNQKSRRLSKPKHTGPRHIWFPSPADGAGSKWSCKAHTQLHKQN